MQKSWLTKTKIKEILRQANFDPSKSGPLKVVIDLKNIDYLLTQVSVNMQSPNKQAMILESIKLLVIAFAALEKKPNDTNKAEESKT